MLPSFVFIQYDSDAIISCTEPAKSNKHLKEEAQISTEVESRVSACEIEVAYSHIWYGNRYFTLNYLSLMDCNGGGWDPARQQSCVPLHQ